ncbi:MAG TPA: hypothetical protein VK936_02935 [Longimicrobiales bacterium]|nr:hypothetical protein [Longimicrobiales bacterium]
MTRTAAAMGIAVLALLTSCVRQQEPPEPQDPPGTAVTAQDTAARMAEDRLVRIEVTGCDTDSVGLAVRPWSARIDRRFGGEVQWEMTGADSFSIVANETPRPWPPGLGKPAPGKGAANQPIQLSYQPGIPFGVYHYRILLWCGTRFFDIDPDLIPRDPRDPPL